jgi:DNA polymerase-3 subunit delta'
MNTVVQNIQSQSRVQKILTRFISTSKIPHALIFTGIEGTGKDYFAIKFAQELNLKSDKTNDREKLVKQISQLSEPYIKYVFPLPRGKNENDDSSPTEKLSSQEIELVQGELRKKIENPYHKIIIPKANAIKINSIRDIKKFLSLDFSELSYRIIIISDAHLMNEPAQNALLKNLEEPPANVVFILTTAYPSRLRETIRSRCWNINFDPLTEEEVVSILIDFFEQDKEIAESVAPFSDGSVQTALKLIDMDFYNLRETTISILRYSFGRKFNSAFDEVNKLIADKSVDNIKLVIKMIITWLNDLQKHRLQLKKYFFNEHTETLEKFNAKFPDVDLQNITFTLDKLSTLVKNNININLLTANLIFELSALTAKKK